MGEPLTLADAVRSMAGQPDPHTLSLCLGGELSITEHDGDYRLHVHVENGQFSLALTALDVWSLRQMTGELVLDRLREVTE